VFIGDVFLHGLGFAALPRGWAKSNTPQLVGAQSPRGNAVVYLMSDVPRGEPRQVAERWASENVRSMGQVEKGAPFSIGGLSAWRLDVVGSAGGAPVRSYITFVPFADAIWRITGAAIADKDLNAALATTRSFRALNDEDRAVIREGRLAIVRAEAGEELTTLTKRTSNAWSSYETAVYNGLPASHRFEGGESVKIAREGPYRPM
jgi:predicted Zn-dependent protease